MAQARPDKVKALALVEPAGFGDFATADALKNTLTLTVFGDFIEQDSRWPTIKGNVLRFLGEVGKAGGNYDVVDLPKIGVRGNSHMMMMDRNSDEVAAQIQKWLAAKGFVR